VFGNWKVFTGWVKFGEDGLESILKVEQNKRLTDPAFFANIPRRFKDASGTNNLAYLY
jgi:hypothetical protein